MHAEWEAWVRYHLIVRTSKPDFRLAIKSRTRTCLVAGRQSSRRRLNVSTAFKVQWTSSRSIFRKGSRQLQSGSNRGVYAAVFRSLGRRETEGHRKPGWTAVAISQTGRGNRGNMCVRNLIRVALEAAASAVTPEPNLKVGFRPHTDLIHPGRPGGNDPHWLDRLARIQGSCAD